MEWIKLKNKYKLEKVTLEEYHTISETEDIWIEDCGSSGKYVGSNIFVAKLLKDWEKGDSDISNILDEFEFYV